MTKIDNKTLFIIVIFAGILIFNNLEYLGLQAMLGNVRPEIQNINPSLELVTLDFTSNTGGSLSAGEEITVQVSPYPLREDYCDNKECIESVPVPESWKCVNNWFFDTGSQTNRDIGCAYREKIGLSCKFLKSGETIPITYVKTLPLTCYGCFSGCEPPGYNFNAAWTKESATTKCLKTKDCQAYCQEKGYDNWRFGDKTCELSPSSYFKYPYIQPETKITATATFEYNNSNYNFDYTIPPSAVSFSNGVISFTIPECSPFPQTVQYKIHLVLGKEQKSLSDIAICNIDKSVWEVIEERWNETHEENNTLPTTPPTIIPIIPPTEPDPGISPIIPPEKLPVVPEPPLKDIDDLFKDFSSLQIIFVFICIGILYYLM